MHELETKDTAPLSYMPGVLAPNLTYNLSWVTVITYINNS